MLKAKKGKACIISVSHFEEYDDVQDFEDNEDSLLDLWSKLGFDVYIPRRDLEYQLTAMVSLLLHYMYNSSGLSLVLLYKVPNRAIYLQITLTCIANILKIVSRLDIFD